jgi:integrase
MRAFYSFLNGTSPWQLDSGSVINFRSYIAVERKVAKSTQNQAFNAILFFFRRVLNQDIGHLWLSVRARPKQRLPVVLTPEEVQLIFNNMRGLHLLMIRLIYAGGLRLNEAVRLRVKDLDFNRGCVTLRAAKGDKDHETLFPDWKECLRTPDPALFLHVNPATGRDALDWGELFYSRSSTSRISTDNLSMVSGLRAKARMPMARAFSSVMLSL